jgi:hypothetical protein
MSKHSEPPKSEESKNPKLLYYSDVIESLRKRFAERFPHITVADRPSPSKEPTIEITFLNRKKIPQAMNQNISLPILSFTLYFRSNPDQVYEVHHWKSSDTTLVVKAHPDLPQIGLYIELTHEQLNTQLDLGGIAPAVILQFDDQLKFIGASLSLGASAGAFGLVTQSKKLLILPFEENFPISQLTHFKLN